MEAAAVRIHLLHGCAGAGDTGREVKGWLQNVRPLPCVCPFAKADFMPGKAASSWCWRNTSAVVQLLREIPLTLVFSPDESLSDLVFNEVSCSRELPRKAIGLNLFTPEECMNNSSPLAFIHLPLKLLPKRTHSYLFNYLFLPEGLFPPSSFSLLYSISHSYWKDHLSVPTASSIGFHRECWLLLPRPCVTDPLTRNGLLLNRPAPNAALRSEVILARGISQQRCSCLRIVKFTATGQQGAAQGPSPLKALTSVH